MLRILYYFTSSELSVIEIKRTDVPPTSPLSEIYKWLVIRGERILELDFKSMEKSGDAQKREFLEGSLDFTDQSARLSFLGKVYELCRQKEEDTPPEVKHSISEYLTRKHVPSRNFYFRPLKPSDIIFFQEWIFDEEVIRYSMTLFHRFSKNEHVQEWFRNNLWDARNFQLGIVDPDSHELIGHAGIAAQNEIDHNGEYFIFIGNKSYWGKGIATEVTKRIVDYGFRDLHLHRIFLTASSKNPGALRAYEKAGFKYEGKMREAFFRNGQYSDKVFMGILKSEFEQQN